MEKLECSYIAEIIVYWFLKKLSIKHKDTIWPASLCLGIYSREMKTCPQRDSYSNVQNSILYNRETCPSTQMPISGWMHKEIYLWWNILAIENELYIATCYNLDEPKKIRKIHEMYKIGNL